MIKNLMTATALSLSLGLAPALAQDTPPPADTETEVPGATDTPPAGGMDDTGPDDGMGADTADDPAMDDDLDTADDPAMDDDLDTADDPALDDDMDTADDPALDDDTDTAADAGPATVEFIAMQETGQWLAEDYIGTSVRNAQDEELGNINDLLVDEDGTVVGAVIGVGGFLGIGQKSVAVNFDAIDEIVNDDGSLELSMDADRETLENAPDFERLSDQDTGMAGGDGAPAGDGMQTGTTPPPAGGGLDTPPPAEPQ